MNDYQLTPHFKLSEFFTSSDNADYAREYLKQALHAIEASRDTKMKSTLSRDDIPMLMVVNNLKNLCLNILEPVRSILSELYAKPHIRISSGYRCKAMNATTSYTAFSLHMLGLAADITVYDPEWLSDLYNIIKDMEFSELFLYETEDGKFTNIHVADRYHGFQKEPQRYVRVGKTPIKREVYLRGENG